MCLTILTHTLWYGTHKSALRATHPPVQLVPGFFYEVKRPGSGVNDPLPSSKCKAVPLQVWTGPESSRRLRLLDFKTVGT